LDSAEVRAADAAQKVKDYETAISKKPKSLLPSALDAFEEVSSCLQILLTQASSCAGVKRQVLVIALKLQVCSWSLATTSCMDTLWLVLLAYRSDQPAVAAAAAAAGRAAALVALQPPGERVLGNAGSSRKQKLQLGWWKQYQQHD
jgi:hypothetical protein